MSRLREAALKLAHNEELFSIFTETGTEYSPEELREYYESLKLSKFLDYWDMRAANGANDNVAAGVVLSVVESDDVREQVREDRTGESRAPPEPTEYMPVPAGNIPALVPVFGGKLADCAAILNSEVSITFNPRGSKVERGWRVTTKSFADIVAENTSFELSDVKGERNFVPGVVVNGRRRLVNVREIGFLTLDYDGGTSIEEAIAKFVEKGIFAVIYTSYSHGKLVDGERIDKFRAIVPFTTPFIVADGTDKDETLLAQEKRRWRGFYTGFAEWLGLPDFDHQCRDLTRVFYGATCHSDPDKRGRAPYACVIAGKALDLSTVMPVFDDVQASPAKPEKPASKAATSGKKATSSNLDLSSIGETAHGGKGFNVPINDILIAYFYRQKEGYKANADEIRQAINDHVEGLISCGETDDTRRRYTIAGGYLDDKIADARKFVEEHPRPSLPYGYAAGLGPHEGYIGYVKKDGDKPVFVRVCSSFEVKGRARTEDSHDWSLVIEFADPEGKVKQARIAFGDLAADSKVIRRMLASAGLWIATGENQKFDALLNALQPENTILFARMPGWQGGGFVTPDGRMIGSKEDTEVILENARTNSTRGTLEGSIKVMNEALRSGVAHWQIAPMIGVAGCLVSFLKLDSCGVALTGATSKGKTTALRIGASAWGDPEGKGHDAIVASLSGTANSFEVIAQRGNGTGVFIDELQHLDDGRGVQQLLFTLAQGEGKSRLRPDGTERERRNWRSFYALTGETGLLQKIESGGGKVAGGVNARVADLDVSTEKDVDEKTLARLAERNDHFGHYGPAFAEWLAANGDTDDLRAKVRVYAAEIAGDKATALEKRSGLIFGLLRLAGELLQAAGLLDNETAVSALIARLKAENTPDAEKPIDRALRILRKNVNAEWNRSIHPVAPTNDDPARGAAVAWRDSGLAGGRVFIPKDQLTELAGGTVKRGELVEALKAVKMAPRKDGTWAGVLQVKGKNDTHPTIPDNGAVVPHYRIAEAFFRGDGIEAE